MNYNELLEIRAKHKKELLFRENKELNVSYKYEVMVCGTTSCHSNNSKKIKETFIEEIKNNHLEDMVRVNDTGCLGLCEKGPIAIIYPSGTFYCELTAEKVRNIVKNHFIGGEVCKEYLFTDSHGNHFETMKTIPFYNKQLFIARRNCGELNPEHIDDYIALNGYDALHRVLTTMKPSEVIAEIKESGLQGRGGAGFPTGLKWEITAKNKADQKYVVCNADEGDPGAFMDRTILESNPHSVLESMIICGYAIGASIGHIYLRAEYPIAGKMMEKAIEDAYKYGLLGKNILDSGFNFDLSIKYGAGAFVCGEETALIHSMEGKRGEPTTKPPYPAESGFMGKPTVINNVETFANICPIILHGAEWFKSFGTENCKGTKVFALTGKINTMGIIELPMGTTIREIVYDIAGGMLNNKDFKAIQMGGPSGGCIPKEHLDTPIDYKSLQQLGSMMGSGGMIVVDDSTCMVNFAKFFLGFTCDESCGKCTACRIGNKRLLEILNRITEGKGTLKDLDELETLSNYIKENSLCGLGQTSPNPVLSTLRYFKDEYIAHIVEHRCPAGECKALLKYSIQPEKCKGCSACSRICPVGAITGEIGKPFIINQEKCIKCGACKRTCRFNAITN